MQEDLRRFRQDLGLGKFETPPSFPYNSMKHQRILVAVKAGETDKNFLNCAAAFWRTGWTEHKDMHSDEVILGALTSVIPEDRARKYMQQATEQQWKDKLVVNTKKIMKQGAFGMPWFEVEKDGKTEYWFGNDRYEQITRFLQVPWHGTDYSIDARAKAQLSKI
jgi:2-hydroxychromene-2-carboxylate isomerase